MSNFLRNNGWNILAIAWAASLVVSLYMVFFYAPVEVKMGITQKIFYVHVGAAAGMAVCVLTAFAGSIAYLVNSKQSTDDAAAAGGQVAVVLGTIVLATGMTWAKAAWGTYFPLSEIKLVLFGLLWIVFVVYLILRASIESGHRRAVSSAIFAIMGFVLMPFVVMATRWFNFGMQLHPNVIRANDAGMPGAMLATLLVSIASWILGAIFLIYITARIKGIEHTIEMQGK